jgi:hypothetical protein
LRCGRGLLVTHGDRVGVGGGGGDGARREDFRARIAIGIAIYDSRVARETGSAALPVGAEWQWRDAILGWQVVARVGEARLIVCIHVFVCV